jgi:predicted ArsR family transcriptional regulator
MQKLDAIGDPDLRLTLRFARAQPRPITADDVAAAHEVHRNVARARLERLAEAGLLVRSFERRTGRSGPGAGRPAKTYRVAPELSSIEFPRRHHELLVRLLADALPERARSRRLHEIGLEFGRELARQARLRPVRRLDRAVVRVCSALGRLGYQASVAEETGTSAVVTTPTCPLRPLVRADARLTALDRGMWTGLVAAAFAPADATAIACQTTAACQRDAADCRVELTLRIRKDDRAV